MNGPVVSLDLVRARRKAAGVRHRPQPIDPARMGRFDPPAPWLYRHLPLISDCTKAAVLVAIAATLWIMLPA